MPTLPPYSTYRTDSKQMLYPQATSHGNILTFTPPGFKQSLHVKFPDSRLAVCEKCKKNFKTRDMCRVRNVHTTPPWSTAYICITLDESCTDENGKYIDKPLTLRMVQWQPFCTKKPFDAKTPVCASCKRTNRTRNFCRERHKHRHLPWCTVYVLLSALDQTDPSTVVAGASKKVENDDEEDDTRSGGDESKPKPEDTSTVGSETIGSEVDGDTEDINDIQESRTFLAKVSSRGTSIHWLELAEYDGSADPNPNVVPPNPHEAPPPYAAAAMPPNDQHAQYFAHAMGYAAQQHQSALKSHQQYFFQMQQRQQQYGQPPGHWQYMGQGDPPGSAPDASAYLKRGSPDDRGHSPPPQPYPPAYYAHQHVWDHAGQVGVPPEMQHPEHYQGDANGDSDELEAKRQRVV